VINCSIKANVVCVIEKIVIDRVRTVLSRPVKLDPTNRVVINLGVLDRIRVAAVKINPVIAVGVSRDVGKGIGVSTRVKKNPVITIGTSHDVGKSVGASMGKINPVIAIGVSRDIGKSVGVRRVKIDPIIRA